MGNRGKGGDERNSRDDPPARRLIPKRPLIVVLWEGGQAHIAAPSQGAITIGRATTCDLIVGHRSVSRIHARLHAVSDGFLIEDLGSSNGTRVQGEPVAQGKSAAVAFGDVVEIGGTLLTIQDASVMDVESPASSRELEEAIAAAPPEVDLDPAMLKVMQLVKLVAPSAVHVVIQGETGVGKELVAETIHRLSERAGGPFLRLDCSESSCERLETELFGYERGTLAGAAKTRVGLLEAANHGTVLLDEIDRMPLTTQAKLLRVLESREVTRVGGLSPRRVDVRFLAATRRDLAEFVRVSAFRKDLYVRLNGVTVEIPPLRERPEEILVLFERFAAGAAQAARKSVPEVSSEAKDWLAGHAWPGNVRELKDVAERAALFAMGGTIRIEHLAPTTPADMPTGEGPTWQPGMVHASRAAAAVDASDASDSNDAEHSERARLLDVLARCSGNQTRAAQMLGISRRTLLNRLTTHQIARPRKGG